MFLFASEALNISLTVVLGILYIALFIIVNKKINQHTEEMKSSLIWIYLMLLLILAVFIGLSLWFFGLDLLDVLTNIVQGFVDLLLEHIGAIIGTVITLFATGFILKVVKMLILKASQKQGPRQKRMMTILKLIRSIITYAIYIIAILIILALWGVNVLPALAGLGIMGLVIGLGAQSLIKDFISGFFIIFEHHFDVGDIVEINGFKGEVIDIGLKTTKIKNWKQDINIIANGSIGNLMNYSLSDSVAVVEFGIAYHENAQKTIDILRAELPKYREKYPDMIEDPNVLGVTDLASSSVNIRVIVKTNSEKQYGVERGLRQTVKEILDAHDIEIPFPQVVVHQAKE